MHDVAQLVSLVGVDPAEEHQHPAVADAQRQQLAAVSLRGGRGEAGQLGHRHDSHRIPEFVDGGRPARSEDDRDVVLVDAGAVDDRGRRLGSHRVRIRHSAAA